MKNTSAHYIFFVFFFGGFPFLNLVAQKGDPQCVAMYKQAIEKNAQRDRQGAYSLAVRSKVCFLEKGDTGRYLKALHLQVSYIDDEPELAIATIDSAIDLYTQSGRPVDYTYYKLWIEKIQKTLQLGRFREVFAINRELQQLGKQLIQNDPKMGRVAIFEKATFLARGYLQNGLNVDGIDELEQAFELDEREDHFAQGQLLSNALVVLSQLYRHVGNLPKAVLHNRLAYQVWEAEPKQTPEVIHHKLEIDNDYALIIEDAMDYPAACSLLFHVISEKKKLPFASEQDLATNYANLGHVYLKMRSFQAAETYSSLALRLYGQLKTNPFHKQSVTLCNLSIIHRNLQQPKAALADAQQAISIFQDHKILRGKELSLAWHEAAMAYLALALTDSAGTALRQARVAVEKDMPMSSTSAIDRAIGETWIKMAGQQMHSPLDSGSFHNPKPREGCWPDDIPHVRRTYYERAIACMQRALDATYRNPHEQYTALDIPMRAIFAEDAYLQAIYGMGNAYRKLYALTGAIPCLDLALQYYQRGAAYLAYVDAGRTSSGLHHYKWEKLWRRYQPMLQAGVLCGYELSSKTKEMRYAYIALGIADLSKGRQVAKRQAIASGMMQGDLPARYIARERALQGRIERARTESGRLEDEQEVLASLREVAATEGMLSRLKDSLKWSFPRAYQLRYENQANYEMTQKAIYGQLQPHQAELEYFVGGDTVYAFLKTPDTLILAVIPGSARLASLVDSLNAQICRIATPQVFAPTAAKLFDRLFPFDVPRERIDQLCIVPDDFLCNLAFPALVLPSSLASIATQCPDYLADHVAIYYDFSLTARYATAALKMDPVQAAHGFYPQQPLMDSSLRDTLNPEIPYTAELQVLEAKLPTTFNQKGSASKMAFAMALQSQSIVELTTHGVVTERDGLSVGELLFENGSGLHGKLRASELYSIPDIQARLLVLNACVMSNGKFLPGEGALSMAHAFRLAGCPTLLAPNWETVPEANEEILSDFYQSLWSQKSAVQALQMAQQNAIHSDASGLRHPFLWASLALYGRSDEVEFMAPNSCRTWLWLVLGAGLCVVGVIVRCLVRRGKPRL